MYLVKEVLGFDDPRKNVWGKIHWEISDLLKTLKRACLILIPRGHLKSTLVTQGWVLQQLLINPSLRILIASADLDNAKNFLSAISSHIKRNPKFKERFGDILLREGTKAKDDTQESLTVTGSNCGAKESSITVASTKTDMTSQHYDIMVFDDLVNGKNCNSYELRFGVKQFYVRCMDLLEPDGKVVVIGTRWHFGDLYNDLLQGIKKKSSNFDFVVNKACMFSPRYERRDFKKMFQASDTEVLFPEKWGLKELMRQYIDKERNDAEFAAQWMNFPMTDKRAPFKIEDIEFLTELSPTVTKYMCVDPAGGGEKKGNDDFAIVVGGMDVNGDIWNIDAHAEQESVDESLGYLHNLFMNSNPRKVGVEKDFNTTLSSWIKERYPEIAKRIYEYRSLRLTDYKTKKMLGLVPYVSNGKFKVLQHSDGEEITWGDKTVRLHPGQIKLINQMIDFGVTEHDDVLDAQSSMLEFLKKPTRYHGTYGTYVADDEYTGY